jgi:hypothetical protein
VVNRPQSVVAAAGSRQVGGPIASFAFTGSGVTFYPQVGGRQLPDPLPQGLHVSLRPR